MHPCLMLSISIAYVHENEGTVYSKKNLLVTGTDTGGVDRVAMHTDLIRANVSTYGITIRLALAVSKKIYSHQGLSGPGQGWLLQ